MSAAIEDSEVSWKVMGIEIYGTVTAPVEAKSNPAVIMVAGSGPTDRNWCSPLLLGTNGSAKLLAEELAKRGYVTLRYDKMASGPHVRENLPKFAGKVSMKSHVEELSGGVETLVAQKGVDKNNVFALTNSEGGIHAVNYQLGAMTNRFKGLVLTGAPGRSIGAVGRSQLYAQAKAIPNGESLMKLYDQNISEFLASKPMVFDPALPEAVKPMLRALEVPTNLPFSRELWNYNLSEYITRIEEPILVLIGKKDIQIDWKVDGGALEQATAGKSDVSFVYPENANHVLKYEELPLEKLTPQYVQTHYNAPDAELDPESAGMIFRWLDSHRA